MNERRRGGPGLPLEQQASPDRWAAGRGHSGEGAAPGAPVERGADHVSLGSLTRTLSGASILKLLECAQQDLLSLVPLQMLLSCLESSSFPTGHLEGAYSILKL
ncbi:unnamed protein product [Rangifer tarandus platyrhynchus]|uniref:Uncharacterized protein n=1 Tax=Rangifer tarandus platyrhynchus TaxID=3082113 RepID=A0AC59Z2C5_RANTA